MASRSSVCLGIARAMRGYHALVSQLDAQTAAMANAAVRVDAAVHTQRAGIHAGTILMAAPKRKVTPSRKGMRSAGKGVSFVPIVSQCSVCQRVFEPHSVPRSCDDPGCRALPRKRTDAEAAEKE
jgi:ribosomal protein L32